MSDLMLHVVLLSSGVHHDLGALPADDPNPVAPGNRGLVTALLRGHDQPILPDSQLLVRIGSIGGFLAVATSSPYGDPMDYCILSIDVAQGQNLWVQYNNMPHDLPGLNHEVACRQATRAAELMLANLRALTGK